MKNILALIILVLLMSSSDIFCQKVFEFGAPAPEIKISSWLKKTPKFQELSGKTIVLEFWGTWCRPCIMSIPHLNELVEKSANDSVIFISISKEDSAKVSKFLESKEIKSHVAIDLNSRTNINYKISSIPKAYVIDSFGRIIWEGHPMNLTADIINFIASKKHYEKPKE